jgi:hypothetical protein
MAKHGGNRGGCAMSKLFQISQANHARLLTLTSEKDRLYRVLTNVAVLNGKVEIVCSDTDAEQLLITLKVICPEEPLPCSVD